MSIVSIYQGQWHKLFGHPMDEVRADSKHGTGNCIVEFTCKECRRSFKRHICRIKHDYRHWEV